MKYAVIAKLYPNGSVTSRIVNQPEATASREYDTEHYRCIVDVFDDYSEARRFMRGYQPY